MNDDRKAQLRQIMAAGFVAREELDALEREEQNVANASLVGTCQKFWNNYGSGSEGWWLYRRILSLNGGWCDSFSFQHCSDSRIEIRCERHDSLTSCQWTPISEEEFEKAFVAVMAAVKEAHERRSSDSAGDTNGS